MADETLQGLKIAILVTDGFEEVELTQPRKALDQAGADTRVVSAKDDEVRSWNFIDWGQKLPVDLKLDEARPQDFDALLLPGGVINPDKLRMIPAAVACVKAFFDAGKPVAAICHGPWTIIEADKARGRRMTSWPSVRTDLRNAGAEVLDQEAVVDGNMVTSRAPDDIPGERPWNCACSDPPSASLRGLGKGLGSSRMPTETSRSPRFVAVWISA
jgi:protease I